MTVPLQELPLLTPGRSRRRFRLGLRARRRTSRSDSRTSTLAISRSMRRLEGRRCSWLPAAGSASGLPSSSRICATTSRSERKAKRSSSTIRIGRSMRDSLSTIARSSPTSSRRACRRAVRCHRDDRCASGSRLEGLVCGSSRAGGRGVTVRRLRPESRLSEDSRCARCAEKMRKGPRVQSEESRQGGGLSARVQSEESRQGGSAKARVQSEESRQGGGAKARVLREESRQGGGLSARVQSEESATRWRAISASTE